MALITCPECHGQVSDKAAVCPHCGYPIGEQPPRQTEGKAEQADNAERQFCIDRIHAGKVYIRSLRLIMYIITVRQSVPTIFRVWKIL